MNTENFTSQADSVKTAMPPESDPTQNSIGSSPQLADHHQSTVQNPYRDELQATDEPEENAVYAYRSVCRSAIVALVLTGLSIMAFMSPLLIVLPLSALALSLMARSTITRYPDELVGRKPALLAILGSIAILGSSISLHTYTRLTEVPDGYQRIGWGELQPDPARPYAPVSNTATELDGSQIFIKGYVYPNDEQTNLKAFILVRDKGTCCFGGQPNPTDMIYVKLKGDLRVNYSWRQRNLGGIFSIDDVANRRVGKLQQIGYYRLTADHLK